MRKTLLETILDSKKLTVLFQPIFRIQNGVDVYALEALVRGPAGTNVESASILFDYVRRKKAEAAVDRSCLSAICRAVLNVPANLPINVNVHAWTLGRECEFVDFFFKKLRSYNLAPERFTLEIVEHAPNCNVPDLSDSIARLRDRGVSIALDDVGLGQSNYRMMLDCDPDYFKLDAYFARNLKTDSRRRAVVRSVVSLADAMDTLVVAEGIDSKDDLDEVRRAGIELVQANILCPAMRPEDLVAGLQAPDAAPDELSAHDVNHSRLRKASVLMAVQSQGASVGIGGPRLVSAPAPTLIRAGD